MRYRKGKMKLMRNSGFAYAPGPNDLISMFPLASVIFTGISEIIKRATLEVTDNSRYRTTISIRLILNGGQLRRFSRVR